MKYRKLAAIAALALAAACTPAPPAKAPPKGAPRGITAGPKAPPNAATLAAATVAADPDPDAAASVNKVIVLARGDAKLYSTVGGDPAINGEYVYLALVGDPAEGIKTFQIGDFNAWELMEQTPDRVVLRVSHSAVERKSGEIVTYEQKIAVNIPGFEAKSVNVTPVD